MEVDRLLPEFGMNQIGDVERVLRLHDNAEGLTIQDILGHLTAVGRRPAGETPECSVRSNCIRVLVNDGLVDTLDVQGRQGRWRWHVAAEPPAPPGLQPLPLPPPPGLEVDLQQPAVQQLVAQQQVAQQVVQQAQTSDQAVQQLAAQQAALQLAVQPAAQQAAPLPPQLEWVAVGGGCPRHPETRTQLRF